MRAPAHIRGLFFLFPLLASSTLHAQVLVNEQFTDGERRNQLPPSSLQWTYGAHNSTDGANAFTSLDASNAALLWDHANNGASFSGIWAHFAPANSPVNLAVGDTLRLSFDVTFSGGAFSTAANAFRFQLFNSNDSRTSTDFAGFSEPGLASETTFNPWKGYEGTLPVGATTTANGQFNLRERTGNGPGLNTTTNNWTSFSTSNVTEPVFAVNTLYPGFLDITRTSSGVDIRAGLHNVTTPLVSDTVSPFTSFDTVAFFTTDALTHNILLDNILVTVVPEPAALALLLPALLALSRRRSSR